MGASKLEVALVFIYPFESVIDFVGKWEEMKKCEQNFSNIFV
jgi:hypothetical protein